LVSFLSAVVATVADQVVLTWTRAFPNVSKRIVQMMERC
jgi:hypothetical protein